MTADASPVRDDTTKRHAIPSVSGDEGIIAGLPCRKCGSLARRMWN